MSVDAVRKLLGSLQDDPENEGAWTQLEERAVAGELAALGADARSLFEDVRKRYVERGEPEAAARLLDVEALMADGDAHHKIAVVRERARILEEELLDDKGALAALESIKALDPDAEEVSERIARKKEKWKDLVEAFKKHAMETPDPSQMASHLASAASVILQYKTKGRDKDVETLFTEALSVDPGNLRAIQLYERVLRRRGDKWDELAAHLEKGAQAVVDVGSRTVLLLRAARIHASRRKDAAAAEKDYRQVLQIDSANQEANRNLVHLLSEQDRTDDLVKVYENQLRLPGHEQDLGLLVQVAMTHWRMRNDPASAAAYFVRVTQLQPEHPVPRTFFLEHPNLAPPGHHADDAEVTMESSEEEMDAADAHPAVASESAKPVESEKPAETAKPVEAAKAATSPPAATEPARAAAAPKASIGRVAIAVDLAAQAEEAGQTDRAIEGWKGVLRLDATNTQARNALTRLYSAASRWNNLVELLRQELEALGGVKTPADAAVHRDRKLEVLREMVGIYQDKMSLEPMVVQTYNQILAVAPDDMAALTALGRSYEKLGRHSDLIKVLEQQVEHTTDTKQKIEILRRVAKIWVERFNNANNATKPLEQIVALDPANAEALGELKDLYAKRRAYRPLFDVLRKEADTLEGNARRDALIEIAKLAAEKLNSAAEAIGVWREALALDPRTPGALDALEKLTDRERDYAGLADVLEKRVAETTDTDARVNLLMKLGTVYGERLTDPVKSIDAWRRVLQAKPSHPKALRVLREAYTGVGDWDALESLYADAHDYEGLVEVLGTAADKAEDPQTRIALSFRAASIFENRLNQPARAFRSYERVLSVDPKNLRAATALVPLYLVDEKWSRLAQLYEILLGALPSTAADQALDYLEKLRELAAAKLNDRGAAFRWALRAFQIRPDSAQLEAALEKAAADAGAWKELAQTFDERAATVVPAEKARLRDKAARIEADRLGAVDSAIARYQAALSADPGDANVIDTLDKLLRRAERFRDLRALYDVRLEKATGDARRKLLVEVAHIEEEQLRDPDAAAKRYRTIVEDAPRDADALGALSRLAETGGRWDELATLISQRRDEATGAVRAELAFKLGQLRGERLGDVDSAIASYREVLSLVPHHSGALAALETLLRDEQHRVIAATLLEPEFTAIGEAKKLGWVMQILLDASKDPMDRRGLTLRLSKVYSDQLADPRSAFELVRGILGEQPDSSELGDELEATATRGDWNEELADTFAKILKRTDLEPAVRVDLARRAASVYDTRLQRPEAAEPFHRIVVEAPELDARAFEALKGLYQERERWDDLRGLYLRWVERSPDAASKIELLSEEALIVEEMLDHADDAIDVYKKIHALDPSNRVALRSLDRLYARQSRWADLAALFTAWLDAAPEDARELRFRRAEVSERELKQFEAALDDYEAVVSEDPGHKGAREGLERIVQSHPDLRVRAGAVLEKLYESDGDTSAASLVRMLSVRLDGTTDADERAELFRRIAELREVVLNDPTGAFEATVQAVLAAPESESFRTELLRLGAMAQKNAAAADTLEKAAQNDRARPALVAILRDLASLYDERLNDPVHAEKVYRRLLEVAPDDAEVALTSAVALERVYQTLGQHRGLVVALKLRAQFESDADVRRELYARAGEILELELKDPTAAIESQRARLEIDPNDREALKSLARLYENTERWSDLVATRRADATLTGDATEQKKLQLLAAHTLEEKLTDIDGAIGLYVEVLETFGPDHEIHRALARLYEYADKWPELLDVLERDLEVAGSTSERLALIVRIAELRRLRTHDLSRAVEGYQEALGIEPGQAESRAALDSLLGEKEAGVALSAARALAPVLETESAWERLVAVLDRIATETDDDDERRKSLARAADVCEVALSDSGRAFGFAAREFREALSEGDLRDRMNHIERLANSAGMHAQLATALREFAPDLIDPDLQIDAYMKIAELSQGPLSDRAAARTYYEKALEQRPDHMPALDALERLHEGAGEYVELIEALRRKAELATTDDVRRELQRKQARISEEKLGDRKAAASAYEAILEIGPDREAAQSLERIYTAESRWSDLTQLLENQLTQSGADVVELHYRLGVVAATHTDDPDRALEQFHEVLERKSDHAATVAALEELGRREGYAARTAEMLEPIYLARMDWPKVIGALEARIAAEQDVIARKELLTRLGNLYEESLEDLDKALDTFARVFREELSDRTSWETVARLARLLGRFDRQAEIYASALADVSSDDDDTAELAFQAAKLFDQSVKDSKRAQGLYRRALAFDPSRTDVFHALETLLLRENSHAELLSLYREAAESAGDPADQTGYYYKIAEIQQGTLQDIPAAIDTFRKILEIDPLQTRAVEAVDALLSRAERWHQLAELLEQRVNDASDPGERATLRFRLGKLRVDRLDDATGAVDAFEAIVQEKRDHRDAIGALEQIADRNADLRSRVVEILEPLYRELDDWPKLIVVLNVRLQTLEDPIERGAILREIAQLKERRAGDVSGSFGAYASAFSADPGDGEARAEVERLAAKHGLWDELVRAYEAGFAATTDAVIQGDLLEAIARTHDAKRDDPRAAIAAYERLYALDESRVEALDLLQGLHVLLSDWDGLVKVLERKVERSHDDDSRKSLLHEIGEYERDMLTDSAAAIAAFKRALEIDPSDAVSLAALDDLYVANGDARSLADVLRQRIEIESDGAERRTFALRMGRLWETELKDSAQAIEAYRRALDDAPTESEALLALDRLFGLTGAHSDLLENLRTQASLAADEASRNKLRLRMGRLLAGDLADPSGALEVYREVLNSEPNATEAIDAVRKLAQREAQRADAVSILEPIFRQAARWNELVEVLELKVASVEDPFSKREELRALAEVQENGRKNAGAAFDTHRRALHEDPANAETLADLERLAASLDRWTDLAAILEDESRATNDEAVGRDLAVRGAQIAEDRLRDDIRATASYRHALSHGDDDAILAALDRIYVRNEQWREVGEVLERRVAIASDPVVLDQFDVRIAELREQRFGDPTGALGAYRNVLERTPSHAPALAGIERLIENPATRAEAMDLLEQTYTTLDDSTKLAWLLSLRVRAADLASDKVRLLQDISRIREERLRDPRGAFDALVEAFKLDPRNETLLSDIERLAPVASAWEDLRGVVEAAVIAHRGDLDSPTVAQLNIRAARWYRQQLNDDAAAEKCLVAAVAAEPESADALEMLEAIQRAPGRQRDLVATLRRRAEIELDQSAKKQQLREAAEIAESQLADPDMAAEIVAALLESDDGDLQALETLARLRSAQKRHSDVAELLSRRARLVEDSALATRLRREVAELYAGPINDLTRATQAYREILDFDPTDQAARTAIEEILDRTGKYKDLEDVLRSRVDAAVTPEERNITRLRLAKLAEERFSNTDDAINYLRQILEETPTHSDAGTQLERLYTAARRWSDLSELLERRAQDHADAHDLAGELTALVRLGALHETELHDVPRAVELYERVLARDANHVGALLALARLHEGEKQWDRTSEMLDRALALAQPGAEGSALALRLALLRSEKLSDEAAAETALRKALELDPTSQPAIDRLKAMAQKRNDWAMLAEILEREVAAVSDVGKKVTLYRGLADIARDKLRDPGRAAQYLEKARDLAPDSKDLLLPLVDMYLAAGRQRDAVPAIQAIIGSFGAKRSKELATWYHRLGQAQEALGDTAAALVQYDAAFKIDLTNVAILRDLGMLCYKTGDLDRAQKTLRALLLQRLDANSGMSKADVYYYLGDTLRQQNDKPKAINMLERALEADKTHAKALELLAQLKA